MEASPISTVQLPSPPASAGADAAADSGALPAGPEGDFHAVLARNLAGHESRAIGSAGASAMPATEDVIAAVTAALSSNLPGHASGIKGNADASTLPAAEDGKTDVMALLSACTQGHAGASALPAAEDGKTDVPAVLSPDLAAAACAARGPGYASEGGIVTDEAAQDEPTEDSRAASEDALALLAALPQAMARPESQAAAPAQAGRNLEGIGGERAAGAGSRTADPAVPGAKFTRAGSGEPGLALQADPSKTAELPIHGAAALADASPAPAPHGPHAALHAGHASFAPLGVDPGAVGPAPTPAAPRIDTPLGAPGWSTALADRMVMLVGDKQQVAELHINPPQLGPVEITLTLSDDKASLVFASSHATVRETIESSLPRLREVLAESGINLGQASVTADSPRDGSAQAQSRSSFGGGGSGRTEADSTPLGASALAAARRARGMVDLFA